MKPSRWMAALAWLLLWAPRAETAPGYYPPLGDLYLSFNQFAPPVVQGLDRYGSVDAFTPFTFYLLARIDWSDAGDPGRNATDGFTAWEASVGIPAGLPIVGRALPPQSYDFGLGEDNWIVSTTGICVQSASQPVVMVTYSGLLLAPASDLRVTLGPSTPSTFDDPGPGSPLTPLPGWLACPDTSAELYPFTNRYLDGWIEINPSNCIPPDCPIATEQDSWGAMKARFSGN